MRRILKARQGWRAADLEDLIFFQRGYDITKAEQEPGDIPVVSSSGINSYHSESKADGPGVVIGRKGSLGTIHYVDGPYWPHDTTLWSKDLKGNHARFVYYFLHTLGLERYDVGNSNPTLNRNHIHGLAIRIPEYQIQERIASILSAYDDLIENNRRRIQLLEQAARLLYREWFVQLRFPGYEHVKIKDGVPEGWERKPLSELCTDIRESIDPKTLLPETAYIGLEHIPRRSITLSDWGIAAEIDSNKFKFTEGDILFGKIRPYFHKVGFALVDGITSSDAIVIRPTEPEFYHYALFLLSSDEFVALASKTVREGSKMPRADWKFLLKSEFKTPPSTLLGLFNDSVRPICSQLRNLALYNKKLAEARDLLLPRLVNGEVALRAK